MKKNVKKNKRTKLYRNIILLIIFINLAIIFVNQQKTLNSYKNEKVFYTKQLEEQQVLQEELTQTKQNVNSPEYIEKVAREKLGMYLPNERVYIDIYQ